MKRDFLFTSKALLLLADVAMVVLSFALAYYYRTHLDTRVYYFVPQIRNFVVLIVALLPLWLIVNALSGLYNREIFLSRPKEYMRVLLTSVISVMALISYEFFTGEDVFPVRIIAVYFVVINFILMILGREIVKLINSVLILHGFGRQKVLIVGDNEKTVELAEYFGKYINYGYDVVGVVAGYGGKGVETFKNFKTAVEAVRPAIIMQTDITRSQEVYHYALSNHLTYMFVPQQDRMVSRMNSVEIIAGLPIIEIQATQLFGVGRVWKRLMDIVVGGVALLLLSPIMLLVAIIMKLSAPREAVFFRQTRLTRFNREFRIYKFRSQKSKYNGTTPEEAFTMMGRPELIKQYRDNGDQLDNDPRITRLGRFLRATSLDELPQLLNVVKGDISLVGPRALIPQEINQYKRKDTILAVKSGLTGLAQVSGRRDISFEERRQLDVYYVQNWSLWLDIRILVKTFGMVLFQRGAR